MAGETPDVRYQAAEGTPDQMQRGEASSLNAALPTENPTAPEGAEVAAPAAEEEQVLPAEAADYEPIYEPGSEDEAFITGPTMRADEAQWVGATDRRTLPEAVRRHLGPLQEAAAMPGASAELVTLVKYLLRQA